MSAAVRHVMPRHAMPHQVRKSLLKQRRVTRLVGSKEQGFALAVERGRTLVVVTDFKPTTKLAAAFAKKLRQNAPTGRPVPYTATQSV